MSDISKIVGVDIATIAKINNIAIGDIGSIGGADIPSGFVPSGTPVGWWDASTISATDGDKIQTWLDLTVNGNNLLQPTESKRPTYKSGGADLINGLTILRFVPTNAIRMEPLAFTLAQPCTIFVVVKPVAWAHGGSFIDGFTLVSALIAQRTTTPNIALYGGSTYAATNTNCTTGSAHVITARFDGASSFLRVDGANQTTGNPGSAAPNGLTVNGNQLNSGHTESDFCEIIVYNGSESVATNEAGLMTKWGI